MGKIKSLIVTVIIMVLFWWVYALTDMYAWGAHQIVSGILEVSGFILIGLIIYLFLRFSEEDIRLLARPKKRTWDQQWSGEWQR